MSAKELQKRTCRDHQRVNETSARTKGLERSNSRHATKANEGPQTSRELPSDQSSQHAIEAIGKNHPG